MVPDRTSIVSNGVLLHRLQGIESLHPLYEEGHFFDVHLGILLLKRGVRHRGNGRIARRGEQPPPFGREHLGAHHREGIATPLRQIEAVAETWGSLQLGAVSSSQQADAPKSCMGSCGAPTEARLHTGKNTDAPR
jgi:hypothetical protein